MVYEHQGEVTDQTAAEALKGYAKDSGADPAAVAACIDQPETEKRVQESIALGQKLGVTSTPTFFINGRKVGNFREYAVRRDQGDGGLCGDRQIAFALKSFRGDVDPFGFEGANLQVRRYQSFVSCHLSSSDESFRAARRNLLS